METSMKQISGGTMKFKKTIHPNGYLLVVSIFLIALLFIPIAGNAGPLATIVITSVPALGTPPTIAVGQSVVFTAEGKDAEGNTVPIPDPQWYSDGGHGTTVVDPNDPNKCTYTATNRGAAYIQCCDGKPGYGVDGSDDFIITSAGPPCTFNCGDGKCCETAGEDKYNCCQDCGSCGDDVCCEEAGEDKDACCFDCGRCGDGVRCAAAGEYSTCCQDCGWCGDFLCCAAAGENVSNCPDDCSFGCGDGVCCKEEGENKVTCCLDCGVCGDGVCCKESYENAYNCFGDCGGDWWRKGEGLYNKGVGEDISTYGDGTPDGLQSNVGSIPSATGTGYLTVEVILGCRHLEKIRTYTEASQGNDNDYDYPYGLVGFELPCSSAIIRVYFHGASDLSECTYRNYGSMPPNFNNPQWYTLPDVTFGTVDIGGQTVAYAEFPLTDGQLGDDTGVDGVIYGQGGPGIGMPHDLPGSGDEVLSFDFW